MAVALVRMLMILSLAATSAPGVGATEAPAASDVAVLSRVRFHTITSYPLSNNRKAIAVPIRPVPAIPIFISHSKKNYPASCAFQRSDHVRRPRLSGNAKEAAHLRVIYSGRYGHSATRSSRFLQPFFSFARVHDAFVSAAFQP